MASQLFQRVIFSAIAASFACHTFALAKVTVVSSSRNKIYLLISEGLQQTLEEDFNDVCLSDGVQTEPDFEKEKPSRVIAIGNAATLWAKKNAKEIPLTASGVILRTHARELRDTGGVRLDFPFNSYLNLIREYLPDVHSVGFIYDSALESPLPAGARKPSDSGGLRIEAAPAAAEHEISAALQSLKEKGVESFIATYDPIVMNPESIKFIVEFCAQNRIALIVPSKALLKNGGLLSLEADYVELGRQTGLMINRILKQPDSGGAMESPQKSEVGINMKMAEALNITFKESAMNRADYIHR